MYRVKEKAEIGGLCAGISEATGIKVDYIRLFAVIIFFFTGFFPAIIAYIVLCIAIPTKEKELNRMIKMEKRLQRKTKKLNKLKQKREKTVNFFEQKGNEVVDKIFHDIKTKINGYESQTKVVEKRTNYKEEIPFSSEIHYTVEKIKGLSRSILEREKSNAVVAKIIEEFKDKIIEFENYSPSLEKQYFACFEYLRENNINELKISINSLNEKIELSAESVKKNYLSMLEQKESRLKLLEDIKEYTEIIESKLYLILDTLQNIEASIIHAELQSHVEDENYDNLQSYISVLTENMSEMSDIFQKSKVRL